jgi:alkylhydroperoxidase/carboxymuconolactone decarboxylase family protein YurZ
MNINRSLRVDHAYVQRELHDMAEQLDMERRLVAQATCWTLLKEMWEARNRKRTLISIGLMVCQQCTGTNTLVRCLFPSTYSLCRKLCATLPN